MSIGSQNDVDLRKIFSAKWLNLLGLWGVVGGGGPRGETKNGQSSFEVTSPVASMDPRHSFIEIECLTNVLVLPATKLNSLTPTDTVLLELRN